MPTDSAAHFAVCSCLIGIMLTGCNVLVDTADRLVSRVDPELVDVSAQPADATFHRKLFVADLHADTLGWDRETSWR